MKLLTTIAAIAGLQAVICSPAIASERLDDGLKAYAARCATCHDSGSNGAPRTNEPQDWKNRSALWESVLLAHAKSGWLDMPAKGGDENMPEYDVDVAAEYMLNVAHPNFPRD